MGFREEVYEFQAICRLLFSVEIKIQIDYRTRSVKLLRLPYLPSEIQRVQSLKVLDIEDSPELRELPPEIGSLKYLKKLRLRGCKISSLPAEIGGLVRLSTLFIINTPLTNLPPEIGNLKNLETLGLAFLPLKELPKELTNLQNLRFLKLDFLLELKELHLEYNELNRDLVVDLFCMDNLKVFPPKNRDICIRKVEIPGVDSSSPYRTKGFILWKRSVHKITFVEESPGSYRTTDYIKWKRNCHKIT